MDKRNLAWFVFGTVGTGLLSVFTIPLLSWTFDKDVIGQGALLIATGGLAVVVFSLGLDQAYMREYYAEENKGRLFWSAMTPGLLSILVLSLIILAFRPDAVANYIFGSKSFQLSVIVLLYVLVLFVSKYLGLVLRMRGMGKEYASSFAFGKILFLIALAFFYVVKWNELMALLCAYLVSQVVTLLYSLIKLLDGSNDLGRAQLLSAVEFKRVLSYALPIAISGLIFWAMQGVDKFMLRALSTFGEVGVYSIALSIAGIATMVTNMFTTVWVPVVYKWIDSNSDLDEINGVYKKFSLICVLIVGLVYFLSSLVKEILPADQSEVSRILIACLLSPLFYAMSEISGIGLAAKRMTKFLLLCALIAFIVSFVLNYEFMNKHGALAAAGSISVSMWLYMALKSFLSAKYWRRGINGFDLYVVPALLLIVGFVQIIDVKSVYHIDDALVLIVLMSLLGKYKVEFKYFVGFTLNLLRARF